MASRAKWVSVFIVLSRKRRYLNWRFADQDRAYTISEVRVRFGRPVGYLVAEKKGNGSVLGDLFMDPDHLPALQQGLHCLGHALRVQSLSLWISRTPFWLITYVLQMGFQKQPEPQGLWFIYRPSRRPQEL